VFYDDLAYEMVCFMLISFVHGNYRVRLFTFLCEEQPSFDCNVDSDPTFHFNADPDLQKDANLRPLVYGPSTTDPF
jgi:hypothetical protein